MAFILPKGCRNYFQNIFDASNKDGKKLKLYFDEYYFCLLVGLACGKYENAPEYESSSQMDEYPNEYMECRDYLAGLLIATEAEGRGIEKNDAIALEKLMVEYIDSTSRTRLNSAAEKRLNQYAVRGFEVLREKISRPYKLELFLEAYYQFFADGTFTEE